MLVPPGYPISFIIETKRTIERRLIHTLHSVGRIIPRFGIAIRPAAGDRNVTVPGGAPVVQGLARTFTSSGISSGRPKAANMQPVSRATLSPLMIEIT